MKNHKFMIKKNKNFGKKQIHEGKIKNWGKKANF